VPAYRGCPGKEALKWVSVFHVDLSSQALPKLSAWHHPLRSTGTHSVVSFHLPASYSALRYQHQLNYDVITVMWNVITNTTKRRVRTSMYSLTFRVRVAAPTQYGRNGTASLQITSHMQQARRFYRWCVRRALGLADYRWALPCISIMLP